MTVTAHVAALQTFHEELAAALKAAWEDEKKHRGRRGADLAFGVFLDDCSPDDVDLRKSIGRIGSSKADPEKRRINLDTMQTIDMHVFTDAHTRRSRIPRERRERLWILQDSFFSLKRDSECRRQSIKADLGHFEELLRGESLRELQHDPGALANWSARLIQQNIRINRQRDAVRNGRAILRGLLARQSEFPIKSDAFFQGVFSSICYGASCAAVEIADEDGFQALSLLIEELAPSLTAKDQWFSPAWGARMLMRTLDVLAFWKHDNDFWELINPLVYYLVSLRGHEKKDYWFSDELRGTVCCYWNASLDAAMVRGGNDVLFKGPSEDKNNRYEALQYEREICDKLGDRVRASEMLCSLSIAGVSCQVQLNDLELAERNLVAALHILRNQDIQRYSLWSDFYAALGKFMGAIGHLGAEAECLLHVSKLQAAIGNQNAEKSASDTRKGIVSNLIVGDNSTRPPPSPVVDAELKIFVLETPPPLVPRNGITA